MTRFARAKGSKASNERVPEKATPWNVMKQEMQRKQEEIIENKEREKHDKMRQENYDNFLKEQIEKVEMKWAEFPDAEVTKSKKIKKNNKNEKNNIKKSIKKNKKLSREMLEMLKSDDEIDANIKKLTSKLDKILDETKGKKKSVEQNKMELATEVSLVKKRKLKASKKKSVRNQIIENSINENIEDDIPVEISSKIKPVEIKIKKKKNKVLKIESVSTKSEIDVMKQNNDSEKEIDNEISQEINGKPLTKSMKKRLKQKKKLEMKNLTLEINSEKITKSEGKNANNKNGITNERQENGNEIKKQQIKLCEVPNQKRKFSNNDNVYEKPYKFAKMHPKMKVAKIRDNKEHKRRKPNEDSIKLNFNGREVEVVKFDGFPVRKEDADRLHELRKQMISKGIPRSEVNRNLQLERRRAEKALAREKKNVCYQCRKSGHMLSECPELTSQHISFSGSGICFKCGSAEHTHFECKVTKGDDYKFASCFICKEQGHIARQCPDNPKGLYPQGGACKLCGDVTHLKKDCPQGIKQKEENAVFLNTISGGNIESIDDDLQQKTFTKSAPTKNKVIKF